MSFLQSQKKKIAICIVLVLLSVGAIAQQVAYESPAGTKFLLYAPPGYSSNTSAYPLLLSLHSKGEVGYDLSELTSNNPEQMPSRLIYLNRWPQDLPFIVLTPQLKPDPNDPEIQWSADYIDEVVNFVLENYRVDHSRIYVTGISRGGTGSWTYASAYPEKVAALLPMSGRSDLTQACPIKDIPIWAFHGDGDPVAPRAYSIDMVNAIKACQPSGIYRPRLNILHARDHNGWNEIYNGSSGYKVYEWLLMFRKGDTSNKKPYVNAGRDLRIALRDGPLHIIGDFFDWDGSVTKVLWKQTAGTPLTLSDTGSEFLQIRNLQPGGYEFELTVTDDKGAVNSDRVSVEIADQSASPAVTQLVLINGKTNTVIGDLSEGKIIDRTALDLTEMNIRAVVSDGTASVLFTVNTDQNTRTQNPSPYFIKNQTTSPEWVVRDGVYLICATPYAKTYATGNPGISQCYKVVITDGVVSPPCSGGGKIQQEVWTGLSGTSISSIPQDSEPSFRHDLTLFEGKSNLADYYGSRIRGFICPPASGNYVFWISGNDRTELWLSTDDDPAKKRKIAYADGYTGVREWEKYTTQRSAPIALVANKKYYVEALHKELHAIDHIAVGWQLPNGTLERPLPGIRLIPFEDGGNSPPTITITSPAEDQQFTAPATVSITATASDTDGNVTKVEFYNGTNKLGEDLSSPYAFAWNNISGGTYTLIAKAIDNNGTANSSSVRISVTSAQGCIGAGSITHEMWTGIPGSNISSIPQTTEPNTTGTLTIFETPQNVADFYGRRIRGYICAPASGNYVFWISGNDRTELWLSTSQDPSQKRRIAYTEGYTALKQWDKFATQKSSSIALVADQKYYIEALHKELEGLDHVAVGWQLPGGTLERPIPGMRLIPFDGSSSGGGETAQPVVSITSPDDGQTFTAPTSVAISANASVSGGSITKVEFYNGTTKLGEDLSSPYDFTWNNVSAGNYTIVAKATDNNGATNSSSVDIAVTSSQSQACEGAGSITYEMWTGIPGDDISSIPQDTEPGTTGVLTVFETPQEVADYYGRRIRGYICAPASGNYVFWISGNDKTELWLSTDANPSNKRRIAYTDGFTYFREWNRHATQQSAQVALVANQRYYIEALHKEMYGKDNVSVGWQLPGGTLERPIPGMRLIPFVESSGGTTQAVVSFSNPNDATIITTDNDKMASKARNTKTELHIYPNPASASLLEVVISGLDGMNEVFEGEIEIQRMTGEVLYSVPFNCRVGCTDYSIALKQDLTRGVYLVNVITRGKKVTKRLLIK